MNSLLKLTPEELGGILLENQQQARLLGMSAERECALRGKVDRLERELTQQAAQFHADIMEQPWLAEIRGYSQRVATLTAELAAAQGEVERLKKLNQQSCLEWADGILRDAVVQRSGKRELVKRGERAQAELAAERSKVEQLEAK